MSRVVAVVSLHAIGIRTHDILVKIAASSTAEAREEAVAQLGWLRSKEGLPLLCQMVADPRISEDLRKSVARSLHMICDPSSGPALLRGLEQATWSEAQCSIVEALGDIRYSPAGPKILEFM
jgi:HEAT repeat protein